MVLRRFELLDDPLTRGLVEGLRFFADDVRRRPERVSRGSVAHPAVNVRFRDDAAVVKCFCPGMPVDGLNVTVDGRRLEISGERAPATLPEGSKHLVRERWFGSFKRSIELPFEVNEDVEATYADGVLTVTAKKRPEQTPRKITIASKEG